MQHDIVWHQHQQGQKMWTANVGKVACTILPPRKSDPLPYYWWELIGPHPFIGRGGSSSLEGAKKMVAEHIDQCAKKAAKMPENITNISEVGI